MTEVCIYTRISSDPNADNADGGGLGVARQEKECRALAAARGWTVTRVYSDNDISAYNGKKRPDFEDMLAAVKRGQYDALICWHPDRLYRSMKDLERIIDICDAAGVTIYTVNGGDLDLSNATGKMLARILGSVNRQESEHKAERIRAAKIQRAEAGLWHVNTRVFGYTMDGTIVPAEAKLIRKAAKDVLAGRTITALARDWNRREIRTAKGNKWVNITVKRLLINPRYAGLAEYKGRVIGPGQWKPIIDPEDHAGLVALLNDASRGRKTISWERKYIGSYRYLCGKCGAPLQHYITGKSAGDKAYTHHYRCTAASHLTRRQEPLDAYIEGVALGFMRDEGKVAALLASAAQERNGADAADMRARRAALAAKKDELAALFTEGILDGPAVRREAAKLSDKIAALDSALAELARRSPLAELLSEGTDKLEKRWAAASPDIKGKILDELFTVVVLPIGPGHAPGFRPDRIEIRWHAAAQDAAS